MNTEFHDITAFEFFEAFKKIFSDPNLLPLFKDAWKDRTRFTELVMPKISQILSAKKYSTQCEYFKIDVIGWSDRKGEPDYINIKQPSNNALNTHFWHLGVAVEHENDHKDWTYELVKLLYINCPLRVVIGYYPEDLSDDDLASTIKYASRIVSLANKNRSLIRNDQQYLLILGRNHKDPEKLGVDTYSAYCYNTKRRKFIKQ